MAKVQSCWTSIAGPDRILVATARNLGTRLMTRDQALLDYGRQRHARIVSA